MILDESRLHPVRVPLRHRFRDVVYREVVLIEGQTGWGEFSPFPEYPPNVAARWLVAALEAADGTWPAASKTSIHVNVTVPAVPAEAAFQIVEEAGCTTAKVKVAQWGQSFDDDVARVEAVRRALGPSGHLRLDANGAWSVGEAAVKLGELSAFAIEYCEQPVAGLDEMAKLRRQVDVPLAVDEPVRSGATPEQLRAAADVLVLKAQPMGGVAPSIRLAEQVGLPVVVSSALETSIGLAAGLALAAALPDLPYACGLATALLLAEDVVEDSLIPVGGEIAVRRPVPDPAIMHRLRSPDSDQMLERLKAAADLLKG